jgi:hypothetical protein
MVYLLASAIHHIGWHQVASQIQNVGKKYQYKVGAFGHFLNYLQYKQKALITACKENASTYNLLQRKTNCLTLACIRGGHGKEDHCISIYNEWIFDSNFEYALLLTKPALDLCCLSSQTTTNYDGCANVVTFKNICK